ncbi:hypothetical protein CYMTET_7052, partial [Cymbomonas tetramitiformis]
RDDLGVDLGCTIGKLKEAVVGGTKRASNAASSAVGSASAKVGNAAASLGREVQRSVQEQSKKLHRGSPTSKYASPEPLAATADDARTQDEGEEINLGGVQLDLEL